MKQRITTLLFLLVISLAASGQDPKGEDGPLKRFELGFHFTLLERRDANTAIEVFRRNGFLDPSYRPNIIHEAGLGARITYNLTKYIALEAEMNVFPQNKRANPMVGVPLEVVEPGGRKLQGLFGPKIGIRREKFGVFGKVRPGFIGMDRFDVVTEVIRPEGILVFSSPRTGVYFFNVDVGGVFEYYTSKRTMIRFDIGDTIIRYHAQEPRNINPTFTRHNLQMNLGFGFRF